MQIHVSRGTDLISTKTVAAESMNSWNSSISENISLNRLSEWELL